MPTPNCLLCERTMEPILALAFFWPELRDKPAAFRWVCRHCRIVSTDAEPHPQRRDTE